jgi:hypothetical protein
LEEKEKLEDFWLVSGENSNLYLVKYLDIIKHVLLDLVGFDGIFRDWRLGFFRFRWELKNIMKNDEKVRNLVEMTWKENKIHSGKRSMWPTKRGDFF